MKKILTNHNLIIFLIGSFISGIGTRFTTIALSDKVLLLTGSDFSISMVFLLESIPMLLLGIIAGNFVDRRNKKYLFIITNFIFALTSLLFGLSASPAALYGVLLFNGIVHTLYYPALVSLLPLLIDKDDLTQANGLNASISGIVSIVGYAFAGIVVAYAGNIFAFYLDSISFLLIAFLSLFLRPKAVETKKGVDENASSYLNDVKEGWSFIRNNPYIRQMFTLEVLTRFIIAMQIPLTYVFVENYLGGQLLMAKRSGFLFSTAGVGTLIGGFIIGRFSKYNEINLLSIVLLLDGITLALFSINSSFPFSLILFGILGIVGAFMGSLLRTVIQKQTPEDMIGRVYGFISTVVEPLGVLSILVGGILANYIEVKYIFLICAASEIFTGAYFIKKHTSIFTFRVKH